MGALREHHNESQRHAYSRNRPDQLGKVDADADLVRSLQLGSCIPDDVADVIRFALSMSQEMLGNGGSARPVNVRGQRCRETRCMLAPH